jgi:hypothetical protein
MCGCSVAAVVALVSIDGDADAIGEWINAATDAADAATDVNIGGVIFVLVVVTVSVITLHSW